jgi:hypothetical protein
MGKDKNGEYVPPKGKPNGSDKDTHRLKDAFAATDPKTEKEIADKYTQDGADGLSAGVHVRHANRMTQKDPEVKENKNSSNNNNNS